MLLQRKDVVAVVVIVALSLSLWRVQSQKHDLELVVASRPAIQDHKSKERKVGPKRTETTTTIAPDGTKTIKKVQDVASEETKTEVAHSEVPAAIPVRPSRTRYLGLGVDPLDYARLPRLRGGVTLLERLDVGLAYDARRPLTGGAVTIEAAWRF
jgi:hypothetical protein